MYASWLKTNQVGSLVDVNEGVFLFISLLLQQMSLSLEEQWCLNLENVKYTPEEKATPQKYKKIYKKIFQIMIGLNPGSRGRCSANSSRITQGEGEQKQNSFLNWSDVPLIWSNTSVKKMELKRQTQSTLPAVASIWLTGLYVN